LGNESTENERSDGGELDENVDGGTGGILEWVSNGISDNGGGVLRISLSNVGVVSRINGVGHVESSILRGEVVVARDLSEMISLFLEGLNESFKHARSVFFRRSLELSSFNHLLAVIPGTTSVGGRESNLDTRNDDTGEETSTGGVSEDKSDKEGRDDDDGSGGNHLGERSLSGDTNARVMVGLSTINNDRVLSLNFFNHELSGITDGTHGEGREPVREHGTEKESSKGIGVKDINGNLKALGLTNAGNESTEESEGDKSSGSNGETFTDSGGSVTGGIEFVSELSNFFLEVGHLSNTSSVVRDRAVSVNSEGNREASEHTNGGKGDSVHGGEVEGNKDSGAEADDWDNVGHVSESESLDDIGSGSVFTRLGKVLGGAVFVRGVVLS